MKVVVIAAIASNGVIGNSKTNDLPWGRAYPEDLTHFKAATMGHAVIMGRRTWASLPLKQRPLPERMNYVITSQHVDVGGQGRFGSMDAALDANRTYYPHRDAFIIGGARLFAEALPIADELDLTLISKSYDGDVSFPGGDMWFHSDAIASAHTGGTAPSEWWFECTSREECSTNPLLTFTKWVRK